VPVHYDPKVDGDDPMIWRKRLWDKLNRSVKHLGVSYGDELDPAPAPIKTVYDHLREEDLL
jgi:hypothetical protein